jgi:hypothetical protein
MNVLSSSCHSNLDEAKKLVEHTLRDILDRTSTFSGSNALTPSPALPSLPFNSIDNALAFPSPLPEDMLDQIMVDMAPDAFLGAANGSLEISQYLDSLEVTNIHGINFSASSPAHNQPFTEEDGFVAGELNHPNHIPLDSSKSTSPAQTVQTRGVYSDKSYYSSHALTPPSTQDVEFVTTMPPSTTNRPIQQPTPVPSQESSNVGVVVIDMTSSDSESPEVQRLINRQRKASPSNLVKLSKPGAAASERFSGRRNGVWTAEPSRDTWSDMEDQVHSLSIWPQGTPDHLPDIRTVFAAFHNQLGDSRQQTPMLLTRLFYAIASPDALEQLKYAINIARKNSFRPSSRVENDLTTTVRALDQLDSMTTLSHILRRYYLVRLTNHRAMFENERRNAKLAWRGPKRRLKYDTARIDLIIGGQEAALAINPGSDTPQPTYRSKTQALTDLMEILYPGLKPISKVPHSTPDCEYSRKLAKLKNRLSCARNWYQFEEKFGSGILALIPCAGRYSVSIDQ